MQVCDESSQTLCTVSFWLMPTVVITSPMGRPATKLELVSQDERPRPDPHEGPLRQNSSLSPARRYQFEGEGTAVCYAGTGEVPTRPGRGPASACAAVTFCSMT